MSLGAFWVLVILGAIVVPLVMELLWLVLLFVVACVATLVDAVRGRT